MKTILLPLDLAHDDVAHKVLQRAADLAHKTDVRFVLLTVLDEVHKLIEAEIPDELLAQHAANAKSALLTLANANGIADKVEAMVVRGRPQHEIVRIAKDCDADIIVIASHNPTVADYLLGSVATSVVRHAPCSVMVIR